MERKDFYQLIQKYAFENPEKSLLTIDEESITYREFIEETQKISCSLRKLGIQKDMKVGLILSNSIAWYKIFWSVIRLGAQPVPIDPQSGVLELERLLNCADISICFLEKQYRNNYIYQVVKNVLDKVPNVSHYILIHSTKEELEAPFLSYEAFIGLLQMEDVTPYEPGEGHVMSLACTSGSTGNPKILTVPYTGFYDAIVDMGQYLGFTKDDLMMVGMPLYHQGGFGMGMQVIVNGGSVIYQPQFDPANFLKTVQEKHVTVIQLTSTLAKILISHPDFYKYDLSSIRICYYAGEVLPREIAAIFVEKLGIRVINVIGSSETATMVVWDSDKDYDVDPSDFNELPFTKVHILDEEGKDAQVGELCIYTSAVIYSYYNNEEASTHSIVTIDHKRCFMTGDLVERQKDGRIRFLGRSKRIIKRGANLVYAEEVEKFLLTHPRIEAVAVVAKDHPIIGQQIVAFIQTTDKKPILRNEIANYFQGKLSAYKIPDQVILSEDLPHDIGKIQFKYIRRDITNKKS